MTAPPWRSQAAAAGDELNAATNYPLVRIINAASGQVVYARTHDHNCMGVATCINSSKPWSRSGVDSRPPVPI